MKKLTLSPIEAPQIEINGIVFTVQKSDVDIFAMVHQSEKNIAALRAMKFSDEEILRAVRSVGENIDAILGEGALAQLANGKPVSAATAMSWLSMIGRLAVEAYAENIAKKYE